jgi:hypothetical protein
MAHYQANTLGYNFIYQFSACPSFSVCPKMYFLSDTSNKFDIFQNGLQNKRFSEEY